MLKWGFRIATLVSLMLFIGVIAIWIRSYWISHNLYGSTWHVYTSPNGLWISVRYKPLSRPQGYEEKSRYSTGTLDDISGVEESRFGFDRKFRFVGFGLYVNSYGHTIRLPDWFLAATTLFLPTLWLHRTLKKRSRFLAGHCTHCGYDLRASPDRCPECGTAVARVTTPSNTA